MPGTRHKGCTEPWWIPNRHGESWMEEKDTISSSAGNQENVRKKKPIRSFRNFVRNIWARTMIMCLESTRIGSIAMATLCSIPWIELLVINIVMNVGTGKKFYAANYRQALCEIWVAETEIWQRKSKRGFLWRMERRWEKQLEKKWSVQTSIMPFPSQKLMRNFLEQMGSMHYQIREGHPGKKEKFCLWSCLDRRSTAERKRKH